MNQVISRILLITFVFCCLSVLACSDFKKDPELKEIISFDLLEVVDSIIIARVTADVYNPNSIGAKVKSIDADIYMEGKKVGKIADKTTHQFKGKTVSRITMKTSLNLPEFSALFERIMEQDSSVVEIRGKAKIGLGIASLKMKMDDKITVSVRKELDKVLNEKFSKNTIRLKGLNINKISFPTSNIKVKIAFRNDLAINYIVEQVNFNLAFQNEKKSFGKGKVMNPINIEKNSTKSISSNISITNKEALKQITRIFSGKKIYATGTAVINIAGYSFDIPIHQPVM